MESLFKEYPDLLNVQQMQKALGIGRSWAYKLLEEGTIKHLRIGRTYRIPKTELQNFIKNASS